MQAACTEQLATLLSPPVKLCLTFLHAQACPYRLICMFFPQAGLSAQVLPLQPCMAPSRELLLPRKSQLSDNHHDTCFLPCTKPTCSMQWPPSLFVSAPACATGPSSWSSSLPHHQFQLPYTRQLSYSADTNACVTAVSPMLLQTNQPHTLLDILLPHAAFANYHTLPAHTRFCHLLCCFTSPYKISTPSIGYKSHEH